MKHSFLYTFVVALAVLYGCSNSTSTPPTLVIPSAGTNWTLLNIHRDNTGKVIKTDTSIRKIDQTNIVYVGYSDVVSIVETNLSTKIQDTVYIRYLSNGDISRLSSPALGVQPPVWLTVPYSTHTAQAFNFGGSASASGFTHDSVSFTASFVNGENDTVGTDIYAASVVTSSTWQHATSATKDSTDSITQTNSFIPSKGIFGNRNVSINQINGKDVQREQQILIGVSVK
jgi:hypothetical protein